MTSLSDVQKISNLAKQLKQHGLATSNQDAVRMAENIISTQTRKLKESETAGFDSFKAEPVAFDSALKEVPHEVDEDSYIEIPEKFIENESMAEIEEGKYDYNDDIAPAPSAEDVPIEYDTDEKQVFDEDVKIDEVSTPDEEPSEDHIDFDISDNIFSEDSDDVSKDAEEVADNVSDEEKIEEEIIPAVEEEKPADSLNYFDIEQLSSDDLEAYPAESADDRVPADEDSEIAEACFNEPVSSQEDSAVSADKDAVKKISGNDLTDPASSPEDNDLIEKSADSISEKLELNKQPYEEVLESKNKPPKEDPEPKKVDFDDIFG